MSEVFVTAEELRGKRDQKVIPHLEQYAPVWIIDEQVLLEQEAIQFNVLFQHPHAGLGGKSAWVSRRYRYDAFNNVLYHKGQTVLSEDEALELTMKEPFISSIVVDIPNSYGG